VDKGVSTMVLFKIGAQKVSVSDRRGKSRGLNKLGNVSEIIELPFCARVTGWNGEVERE
jgi:hypothetical protein